MSGQAPTPLSPPTSVGAAGCCLPGALATRARPLRPPWIVRVTGRLSLHPRWPEEGRGAGTGCCPGGGTVGRLLEPGARHPHATLHTCALKRKSKSGSRSSAAISRCSSRNAGSWSTTAIRRKGNGGSRAWKPSSPLRAGSFTPSNGFSMNMTKRQNQPSGGGSFSRGPGRGMTAVLGFRGRGHAPTCSPLCLPD